MRSLLILLCFAAASVAAEERVRAVTAPATDFTRAEAYERNPGGAATSIQPLNASAFSQPSANMSYRRQLDFKVGDGVFRKLWVSAPASTTASDGLGPLFNARSCQSCHLKDGRGRPPFPGEPAVSMLMRLSVPGVREPEPHPVYGGQFQTFSVQGVLAEGRVRVEYEEIPVALSEGETASLRRPVYRLEGLNYGPLGPGTMISPRVAPPMIGLGLIEAIDEADILAAADPDDRDGDGIAGRPNRIWDAGLGRTALGRFGWKAGQPGIAQQTAAAFSGDMGLSTPLLPAAYGDCTAAQPDCRAAPDGRARGEEAEVPPVLFDLVVFYARNLAVPARRDVDAPQVLAGKAAFHEAGCIACHRPKFVTRRDAAPEQAFQLIWPYSNFLLHDMGEGLADGRPEAEAGGRHWRTAPLWGVGLTETVSGHTFLLHDGRARNLLEAILWHGGEAAAARQRVVEMPRAERAALLAFLRSL